MGLFLLIWGVVSLAAFAGMYQLWWQRERVEYLGKSLTEQRKIVFQHAGMPQSYLEAVDGVLKRWSPATRYVLEGQRVQGSYLTYLLIPRVPVAEGPSVLMLQDGVKVSGAGAGPGQTRAGRSYFPAQGLVLSLLSLCGLVLLLRPLVRSYALSFPELFGVACLFVNGAVVLSKVLVQGAQPGFILVALLGIGGWLSLLWRGDLWSIGKREWLGSLTWQALQRHPGRTAAICFGCLLIALGLLWVMLMSVIVVPDDWDAWAIWGSKAKMLALGNGPLADVTPFGHADYPLLWPALWAFSGWCAGGWDELWSRGWGAVFLLLCCWEIGVIVYRGTKRWDVAVLAGALLVTVPLSPLIASWSYAEAPLWVLSLSSFACLLLWRDSGRDFHLFWGALLAVAAAYTKNEGILFFVIEAAWVFTVPGRRIRAVAIFATVFVLLYFPWYYWVRIVSAFSSHATTGLVFSGETLARAGERLPKALGMIGALYGDIRQWNLVLWGLGVGWLVVLFRSKDRFDILVPVALWMGYLVIVVFHEANIYWQVGTSWNRLTLQVMPLLIVVVVPRIWQAIASK